MHRGGLSFGRRLLRGIGTSSWYFGSGRWGGRGFLDDRRWSDVEFGVDDERNRSDLGAEFLLDSVEVVAVLVLVVAIQHNDQPYSAVQL